MSVNDFWDWYKNPIAPLADGRSLRTLLGRAGRRFPYSAASVDAAGGSFAITMSASASMSGTSFVLPAGISS